MRTTTLLIGISLLFAACSSQPTQVITQPALETPTLPAQEAPTAPPGSTVFHIVPGESQVTYEVGETFINQNNRFNLAVGVTPQVAGEVIVDRQNPQKSRLGQVTVDISQFKSDSSRRDNFIRDRYLESQRYPTVTFVPTQIEGLPPSYTDGEQINFKVTGDLTVHKVTRQVTFDVTLQLDGDALSGQATKTIKMSDFEVGPINLVGILQTEDEVKLTFNFVARP